MTKTTLKTHFTTWDEAEILEKFSSIFEDNFPKILTSSYVVQGVHGFPNVRRGG